MSCDASSVSPSGRRRWCPRIPGSPIPARLPGSTPSTFLSRATSASRNTTRRRLPARPTTTRYRRCFSPSPSCGSFCAASMSARSRRAMGCSTRCTRPTASGAEGAGGAGGGGGGGGGRAAPRIGILDWREVPTYSEFVLFAEYFRAHGLDVVIGDPREAELRNGAFLLGGAPVDLIYKRVLLAELVARGGCDHPVIRAVRSGAVCMVNPFRCKILHKKASLAVLSDERNAKLFSAAERRAIDAHVPWTRTVAEQKTLHGGRKVDLVPFILAQRDRLVLKPNDEYGGKGIVLGWEVDDAAWQRAVGAALAEPSVVQERVPIPSEPFPSLVDGRVTYADRILDTNPFACHGAYAEGCLSRLSTAALVNVTAGGGSQVPTFLVEAR